MVGATTNAQAVNASENHRKFLSLLAEIRNKIYAHVLIPASGCIVGPWQDGYVPTRNFDSNLLATCHRIHGEALGIFRENAVAIVDARSWNLVQWLSDTQDEPSPKNISIQK